MRFGTMLFTLFAIFTLFYTFTPSYAQSINISNFYYRDYLDFGQNKGIFKEGAKRDSGVEIIGKDGQILTIPHIPTFQASSNNGNLTSIGRGFATTANHVSSAENLASSPDIRKWGLTEYVIAKDTDSNPSVSQPYGRDNKFLRFSKYIVEGRAEMLNLNNSIDKSKPQDLKSEEANKQSFDTKMAELANGSSDNKVYIYQAGSGIVALRGDTSTEISRMENGETKGGGFGIIPKGENTGSYGSYWDLIVMAGASFKDVRGITYNYNANSQADFNNRITSGDSGSGIYAYDSGSKKWILLGVTSRNTGATSPQMAGNSAEIAFVSQKDFEDYQAKFEQKINLSANSYSMDNTGLKNTQSSSNNAYAFSQNKDIVFSGGGSIEVTANIYRNTSGLAGGFVFIANSDASQDNLTTYKFTNKNGNLYSFTGSGLDIGENVLVEWALKNKDKTESLHKIGKGELKITNTTGTDLGTLKIGEGKVTLNTDKKAFDNIYITSGLGQLALLKDKAEALGAIKATNTYILSQNKNSEMGFYFGTGGGTLDLGGNSLTLNTIAANDKNAIVTNTSTERATLSIEGLLYNANGNKESKKADTIIHATIGQHHANIDIAYSNSATINGTKDFAHLIFDGDINTSGKLSVENGLLALQGHATAHATISSATLRTQIQTAENATQKPMPDYMDLSKPSTLSQPTWDSREFKLGGGITLKNATLTLGRSASLDSNISLDSNSKVEFGSGVVHFIDNNDGRNITGSGFGYYQKVERGMLEGEALKGANETISYKGIITANGGIITSHIMDFKASLDLKAGAKLEADYLTLTESSSISLMDSASASVKTLKLQNISNLSNIFKSTAKLKVTERFWFDEVQNLSLNTLESINEAQNYDIKALKSSVTGESKDLIANIELGDSTLSLKSLTLKANQSDSTQNGIDLSGNSKLTLTSSLKAQNLDTATITLRDKSEILTPKIEFSSVKNAALILGGEAKIADNGTNANIELADSTLNIALSGDKSFDLNASGDSYLTLKQGDIANFTGKITARDSSVVAVSLDNITASIDLSGSAKLTAKNITLDSTHNAITLKNSASLVADKITAKGLTQLMLNADNATNTKEFIFDNSNATINGERLIGQKITLLNSSIIKSGDLRFSGDSTINFNDDTSSLQAQTIKLTNGNLNLNFKDSNHNAKISRIDLDSGSVKINSWDFGSATTFHSKNARLIFGDVKQNGGVKVINADSTINGALLLSSVGRHSTSYANDESRLLSLDFSGKNLTLGSGASISIEFDSSVGKSSGITLGQYITLINASSIIDNRTDKIISFKFSDESDALFVTGKIFEGGLKVKFTESNPATFSELNKHIDNRYSKVLLAFTEAKPDDEAITIAANTDDYTALQKRLAEIDSTMDTIAQGNASRHIQNLLISNDYTLNSRVIQVRLSHNAKSKTPLLFADAMYYLQKLSGIASDASPSYASNVTLENNVWLNVGSGYFGGDSQMGFGVSNIGYDRLFSLGFGDVIVGAMMGVGGLSGVRGHLSENATFYNIGLYASSVFDSHEVQSNLNVSINDKQFSIDSIDAWSAENTAFGMLLSLYYKYNFLVASSEFLTHAIKPIALLAIAYNYNGAFSGVEYKQRAFSSVSFAYGVGVEYNAVMNASFYSVGIVAKDIAYSGNKSVEIGLNGAKNFIGYTLLPAPRFGIEINMVGSHKLLETSKNLLYLQYGITGMLDMKANYGIKGDVKFGWRF